MDKNTWSPLSIDYYSFSVKLFYGRHWLLLYSVEAVNYKNIYPTDMFFSFISLLYISNHVDWQKIRKTNNHHMKLYLF